ncbi:MAG TPA: 30S ribosomal protein S17 [Patescibacteria group bacterium]|nr:30S ribosomal protein S17 [Patescibacteria group bacterium]
MNNQTTTKTMGANGKIFTGEVVSVKTIKTVVVAVISTYRHPLYKKLVRKTKRFMAHNESLTLAVGDTVRIGETKPISRSKHFIVLNKVS